MITALTRRAPVSCLTRDGPAGDDPPDRGSLSVEMTIIGVPVMMLLLLVLVFCGRGASAAIDVSSAAAGAARAAAATTTPAAARTAAAASVAATAAGQRWTCTTSTDTAELRPGGRISVTVTCTVPMADLGLPVGAKTLTAHATQPIDRYRSFP